MTLYEKILKIRSNLTVDDFDYDTGTIKLQNDGNGDYIASWTHPTETQPTAEELA